MERRQFLARIGGTAGLAAASASLGGCAMSLSPHGAGRRRRTTGSPPATSRTLAVGERPDPGRPAGTDLIPQIDHIVVVMLENHSFDNVLGMLGRGDGFTLDAHGSPTNSNPDPAGGRLTAFHMPTPCQLDGHPSQSWDASHEQFDDGKNDGFVRSASGPVSMGYWTPHDMPFTNSLAQVFPLADRWFCSVLAQTYPNRRYLLAGTSLGLIDDTLPSLLPPSGTILDQFHHHGITWRNYFQDLPSIYTWYGLLGRKWVADGVVPLTQFFTDCRSGTLPSFSLVDPNFGHNSEENPQDVQYGDVFLSQVVNAVMEGAGWLRTLLIWTYDEHGGYFDHVPPPKAPTPDDVAPNLKAGEVGGRFDRFGFRVPAGVVSPYARLDHVSHTTYDHTSVLKLVEHKWNLPALTRRDGAANDPLDMIDLVAAPAFARPPHLHSPAVPGLRSRCLLAGPGNLP